MLKTYTLPKEDIEGKRINNTISLERSRAFLLLETGQGVIIRGDVDKDGPFLRFDLLPKDKTTALLESEQDKVSLALDEIVEARETVTKNGRIQCDP